MRGAAKCYDELRSFCESVPLVDCHDHSDACAPKYADAIEVVKNEYSRHDLWSALCDEEMATLLDAERSLEARWPVLDKAWKRSCHTGYAQVVRLVLNRFYGEQELTLDALMRMQERLLDLTDEKLFESILEEANISARIGDVYPDLGKVLDGTLKLTPRLRMVISLPQYHAICNYSQVQENVAPLGRTITSLDEYVGACREIFQIYRDAGAVAFKDQSAYTRCIAFGNPTRTQAEEVFNWIMEDPRRSAACPEGSKPLDDYLFQSFMRMARDLDLPVQIHTGHLAANIRNDITNANAARLTKLMELHRDVRFDLFHANWPYGGELLYLGKNYPNVTLDFCWANIIDPIYCQNLFKQALSCVPHGKIHGYGSDYTGSVDRAWAHARIARDNVAIALSDLVEIEYLGVDEAKEVAHAWLFGNANEFFRLGL